MLPIDYTAPALITWQHPPYGKTAVEEHCEEFNLGEAIRFVMEHLRLDDIGGLYRRADFPRG